MKDVAECRVAVIGAGNMALEHIKAFSDVPGVKIEGIFSRTRERAAALAAEHGIDRVCDSIDDLYEKTKADLVVVTVFETAMNPVCKECFAHPWTVFVEKPPGYNVPDAEDIYNASVQNDRKVIVGLNRRFNSSTRAALDDLEKDEMRRFIHVQDQQDMEGALSYGHPDVVVKNWMYANSIHVIDLLQAFGRGDVTSVDVIVPFDTDNPDVVLAKIVFDSGDLGLYEGIWKGPGPWTATVTTGNKRWELRPLEHAKYQEAGSRQLHSVDMSEWDQQFKAGFRLQAEMAVRYALGKPSESPTLAEAMKTMQLIQDIFGV